MTGPFSLHDTPAPPVGRTARRLEWPHLPPPVRALVEERAGGRVVSWTSHTSGFTPGFASTLVTSAGDRVFVKAASVKAQAPIAASYAEEARKLRLLPTDRLPTTRLLWSEADDLWVVNGFEAVEARPPQRPWDTADLARCVAAIESVGEILASTPSGLDLSPAHQDLPTLVTGWDHVAAEQPRWPRLEEARTLARSVADLPDSDSFVHFDVRDDNLLLPADDGPALLCDWNWPALGPRWLDLVCLLLSVHGDHVVHGGPSAEQVLADSPLTRGVPDDHVDAWIAALCGYMLEAEARPAPPSSPHLATHRRWYAAASWDWLASRRGWDEARAD